MIVFREAEERGCAATIDAGSKLFCAAVEVPLEHIGEETPVTLLQVLGCPGLGTIMIVRGALLGAPNVIRGRGSDS